MARPTNELSFELAPTLALSACHLDLRADADEGRPVLAHHVSLPIRSARRPVTRRAVSGAQELEGAPSSPSPTRTMVSRTHWWISAWFAITFPIILWDAAYCFMRPRSFKGGDLHWLWKPYELYEYVDYIYGPIAYARGDGFTNAQSAMNIIENALNALYLYLAHGSRSSAAPLVGFASAVMTLAKTALYGLNEYFCRGAGCNASHNDFGTLFKLWILPNGFWIFVPTMVVYQLGKDLVGSLRLADAMHGKTAANGKAKRD